LPAIQPFKIEVMIDPYREISIIAGALYLLVFVAGILSIARTVDKSDYLTEPALHSKQVYKAACFQFLMALFYTGIAVVLYPMLTLYNETLALGFLSFRIIAALFTAIGTIVLILIVKLSQEYIKAGTSNTVYYQVIGSLLKTSRDLINHVVMIIMLCIANILLYATLLQSDLIPMWLSVWGIVGSSIAIMASILVMIRSIDVLTTMYVTLNAPIALQEIVFAIWLIVVGFKQV
jgi:hypothetical protein